MKADIRAILIRAIDEGLETGWRRAHKHNESPNKDAILRHVSDSIWDEIDGFLIFDDLPADT